MYTVWLLFGFERRLVAPGALCCLLGSVIGSAVDSLIGRFLQVTLAENGHVLKESHPAYKLVVAGQPTKATVVSGKPIFDNNMTNLTSQLITSLLVARLVVEPYFGV